MCSLMISVNKTVITSMYGHVHSEITFVSKCFCTDVAFVWFDTRMTLHMSIQL